VIAFQAVSLVWVVSEVVIAVTHSAPLRQAGQDRFSQPAVVVSIVVAVWAGYFAARGVPGAAIAQGRPFVIILGVALAAAGIVIRWWAVLSLGRFFTTRVMTRPGQTVVTAGPYGLVRHPSYTGMLLTIAGVLLSSANWVSLACFLIVLPGLAYRIRVEEGALIGALGDPYRDYMRRTKRLVPFVV